jgi:hypothetical protein
MAAKSIPVGMTEEEPTSWGPAAGEADTAAMSPTTRKRLRSCIVIVEGMDRD